MTPAPLYCPPTFQVVREDLDLTEQELLLCLPVVPQEHEVSQGVWGGALHRDTGGRLQPEATVRGRTPGR